MVDKSFTFQEIHSKFCDFIDECSTVIHYSVSKDIQERKISDIEKEIQIIKQYKYQAISQKHEEPANQFFHMQCVLNTLRSILLMWIEVKNTNYSKAWSYLIDAQEYIHVASIIVDYPGISFLENFLLHVEDVIFPSRSMYMSLGHTETIGDCSICNLKFSFCDHIENQIYMGQLCRRVNRKIVEANHIALVKNPRDRRCIITQTSNEEGNMIDYFTGEVCGKETETTKGMSMQSIILTMQSLDLN
jgi:hypothetical protein